jgi:serine protease AprX
VESLLIRQTKGGQQMRGQRLAAYFVALAFPVVCAAVSGSPDSSNLVSGPPASGAGLTDRNQNGISDGLENRLHSRDLHRQEAESTDTSPAERLRVVVTFKSKLNDPVALARSVVGDFPVRREFQIIAGFAADLTTSQIRALAAHPQVFRVEEDFEVYGQLDSARRDFGADAARESFGLDGSGIGICIIDSGIEPKHEQFDNKSVAFFDAVNGENSPYDDHGHGTHVASIAAGDGTGDSDAARFRGVAPAADLYVAKVLASDGAGSASDAIAGAEWCVEQPGVRILSLSLARHEFSDGLDSLSQLANEAVDAGKVLVVAAGNIGPRPSTIGTPGVAEKVVTVGACAEWSESASKMGRSGGVYIVPFSSRGPVVDSNDAARPYIKPDLCAPGHTITAAEVGTEGGYVTSSGTSMATPFVSGAIALALQANPSLTAAQIKELLETTAQDRGAVGKDPDWGAGLIDVKALIAKALGGTLSTSFPAYLRIESSVANNAVKDFSFKVADPNLPIAAMMTIVGDPICVLPEPGGCSQARWAPDLDAGLFDAAGNVLALSACVGQPPLSQLVTDLDCGEFVAGRQETLVAIPSGAGNYRIRIGPTTDALNNGKGGSFTLDISNALASDPEPAPEPEPIPPPTPEPQTCNGIAPTFGCTVNGLPNQLCLGTPEDDLIVGTSGIDVIVGFSGSDTLAGGPAPDLLCGGSGNDTLLGNGGADQLFGEDNDDILKGGRGADLVNGGAGNDGCAGGFGDRDTAADCETMSGVP